MPYLLAVLVLAGMTATGHLVMVGARLRFTVSPLADVAIAFLVGAGTITLVTFWISLLLPAWALSISIGVLAVALAVAVGLVALQAARSASAAAGALRAGARLLLRAPWWAYPAAALVLVDLGLLVTGILRSEVGWDGLFVWGIKARYFFLSGGVPQPYFTDLSREWSHIDYPFLLPISEALVYRAAGTPDERLIMVVIAAFVLCLVVLLHELVRTARGEGMALTAVLLLLTLPAIWSFAEQGMADLPLAVCLLAGGGLVARWLERPARLRQLLLGAFLMTLAVWVKREGLMVWLAAGIAVGLWSLAASVRARRLLWRPVLCYLAPATVLVPWLADLYLHHVVDRNYVRPSLAWLVQHGDRLPVLAHALEAQLTRAADWGVAWLLLAAVLLLNPPLRSAGRALLLWLLVAHLLSLPFIYTFSTWVPYTDHVASSIDRLVLQVVPLALLLLALNFPRLRVLSRLPPRRGGRVEEGFGSAAQWTPHLPPPAARGEEQLREAGEPRPAC